LHDLQGGIAVRLGAHHVVERIEVLEAVLPLEVQVERAALLHHEGVEQLSGVLGVRVQELLGGGVVVLRDGPARHGPEGVDLEVEARVLQHADACRGRHALPEHATDLASVFLGFGIFTANSAFHFQQFSNSQTFGWRSRSLGYLGEVDCAAALAIYAELCGVEDGHITQHLKENPRGYFKSVRKQLRKWRAELDGLREVPASKKRWSTPD